MTEIILTSSVLILLLIVLRRVLRGRIRPTVQYALWLLAAARLLIPGTFFSTPVSVTGAAEKLQSIQAVAVTGSPTAFIDPEQPDGPTDFFVTQPSDRPVMSVGDRPNDGPAETFVTRPSAVRNALNWTGLIWKTGIVLVGGATVASNLIFYIRLRKRRKPLDLPQQAGNLRVYQMDGLPSPCLFGLIRPAVYLNEKAMFSGHLDHILTHELTHYRHGDHLWAVLRSVCLAVHWYNPLVWWAAALSRRDCELACDEASIRALGEEQRIDYGQTLLAMVGKRSPAAFLQTATTMTAGKRAMKERIMLIAKAPKMRKITVLAVALLICVLIACAFGGAEKSPEEPADTVPSSVYLGEMLSSQYRPGPVTDPETVSRLWELYQGFQFDGTTEDPQGTGWSVTASFRDGEGNELAHFTIWADGSCWLEDDYQTYHVLRNGQEIYEAFHDSCNNAPRNETYLPAPALYEFPGLHWNDSVETVLNTLGITEEQFLDTEEYEGPPADEWSFTVGDLSLSGHMAQYAVFRFIRYEGTGHELGLYRVDAYYPDDAADFAVIREELRAQYGAETKNSNQVRRINESWKKRLGGPLRQMGGASATVRRQHCDLGDRAGCGAGRAGEWGGKLLPAELRSRVAGHHFGEL